MVQVSRGQPETEVPQRNSGRSLYDLLQVGPLAEELVIQAAYRALVRTIHPDVNLDFSAHNRMRELNEAYEVLRDPRRRAIYDLSLNQQAVEAGEAVDGQQRVRRRTACWRCTEPLEGAFAAYCSTCHWIVCEFCRSCGCQHPDWQPALLPKTRQRLTGLLGWITAALLAIGWLVTALSGAPIGTVTH